MTISKIKEDLSNHLGEEVTILYDVGRNKVEEYSAIIKALYNYVFLVEVISSNKEILSFSYSDVITKTIKISY